MSTLKVREFAVAAMTYFAGSLFSHFLLLTFGSEGCATCTGSGLEISSSKVSTDRTWYRLNVDSGGALITHCEM